MNVSIHLSLMWNIKNKESASTFAMSLLNFIASLLYHFFFILLIGGVKERESKKTREWSLLYVCGIKTNLEIPFTVHQIRVKPSIKMSLFYTNYFLRLILFVCKGKNNNKEKWHNQKDSRFAPLLSARQADKQKLCTKMFMRVSYIMRVPRVKMMCVLASMSTAHYEIILL